MITLSEAISLYIEHKQALGYRYRAEGAILKSFCKSLGEGPITAIEAKAVHNFINGQGPVTENNLKKYKVLSGFYKFVLTRGFVKVSPLPSSIPQKTIPDFVPYIYSREEIKKLIANVHIVCTSRMSIEENILRTLLLLLYGSGLRIGEALALLNRDVDILQECLFIRETKFFKSRFVPMGKDLTDILSEYIEKRHNYYSSSANAPFFYFKNGLPLSQSAVRNFFRRLRSSAGIKRDGDSRHQPRIHDIRHTAAVHRLIAWYRNGLDVQDFLPKLATYLGHVEISSTQKYITLTHELLRQASNRFENYAMGGVAS
ncbi:MAG: integrase family protein [Candidatus Magnetoglobus multicellularis str. Araruama]|uniref:Integrase family protein n=1 Tax=Candidatus Magnetoglobus multicellularis str. Araruama TaxID=890399 RepID=A0A1V1NWT0_9BACT|nr:MAG: integrase family protein [Candidatus Magnetoglobus multicellularis str. Araruama]